MQTFIVTPGSNEEALKVASEQVGLSAQEVVKPSSSLDPVERLIVYRNMYLLRMEEALSIDYPVLKTLIGIQKFWWLVSEYVKVHPSRSYTLDRLGDHFPEYIRQCEAFNHPEFLAELAEFEQTIGRVQHAVRCPTVGREEALTAKLSSIPAFKLLKSSFPINGFVQNYYNQLGSEPEQEKIISSSPQEHQEEKPATVLGPIPEPGESWTAIWRWNRQVWRLELHPIAVDLMSALIEGQPFPRAARAVLRQRHWRQMVTRAELEDWFLSWVDSGMFRVYVEPQTA